MAKKDDDDKGTGGETGGDDGEKGKGDDDGETGEKGEKGKGGEGAADRIDEIVDAVTEKVLDVLDDDDGEKGAGDDDGKGEPKKPPSIRDVEAQAKDAVEAAMAKIEHEKEHESLRSGKGDDKREREEPPVKVPFLRRLLWGEGD